MQNVVGPTLVAMATTFGLGMEIESPTGLLSLSLRPPGSKLPVGCLRVRTSTGSLGWLFPASPTAMTLIWYSVYGCSPVTVCSMVATSLTDTQCSVAAVWRLGRYWTVNETASAVSVNQASVADVAVVWATSRRVGCCGNTANKTQLSIGN